MVCVTIVAPASPAEREKKGKIEKFFNEQGFKIKFGQSSFECERYLAGSDRKRAQDLNIALTDEETDIVIALRGGYGSPRILDLLDYEKIKKSKKILYGFSDITALQLALYKKCKMASFSGFNADCVTKNMGDLLKTTFMASLKKEQLIVENLTPLSKGRCRGIVLGGTLTMLVSLMGTPYMPKLDKCILVIEEVREQPYRIDRMLNQLRLGGYLDKLAGVVIADCKDCVSKDKNDGELETVFNEYFLGKNIPVVTNFPYGHGEDRIVFPIGKKATLDADNGSIIFDKF